MRIDPEIRNQLFDPAPKKMSFRSQIAFIKRALKKKGIEPDLIDVEALIDPELNYRENYQNILSELERTGAVSKGQVGRREKEILDDPAKHELKNIRHKIKTHLQKDKIYQDLKVDEADAKTRAQCSTCSQMGLYDPAPKKILGLSRQKQTEKELKKKAQQGKRIRGQMSLTGGSSASRRLSEFFYDIPKGWFKAMVRGIKRSSDVRDPVRIVKDIWKRLPGQKKLSIISKEKKGHRFVYDLPLPDDHKTRGVGTVRVVKPFKLAEVQVNVTPSSFEKIKRTRQFQNMRRQNGTVALVKRCKSKKGNCNIFVDKVR